MSGANVPLLAGLVSTTLFVVSYLPMLTKALRTQDLGSYSRLNLVLANAGNGVHSVYVFSLPAGPIWILHTFYLGSTMLMLVWHQRYTVPRGAGDRTHRTEGASEQEAVPMNASQRAT